MLTAQDNTRLTEVGAGTPLGEMLRRYWMPIAPVAELEDHPSKPIRLLGEDLILYKDKAGHYGLIGRKCPHRGSDLAYGMVEQSGIRCNYHGWLFGGKGNCIEQPFEDTAYPNADFKRRVQIPSFPVQANTGLLWAYLGPEPAPLVPNWRNFHRKGYRHLCFVHLPCNWLQVMENAFDQVHNEWMHDKWSFYLRDGLVPENRWRIEEIIHREFDYGWTAEIKYAENPSIFPDRVILWPNSSCFGAAFEWVVPVDDENSLLVYEFCTRFYVEDPFHQKRIPYWTGKIKEPETDRLLTRPPRNQDFIAWLGQSRIADRTKEHLGASDAGIIMFRKKLLEQAKVVARGGEPKGIVRDPEKYFLMLPESVPSGPERDGLPGALRTSADMRTIGYVAGFPEEIANEIAELSKQRGERIRYTSILKSAGWKIGGKDFSRDRHFAALANHGLDSTSSESAKVLHSPDSQVANSPGETQR